MLPLENNLFGGVIQGLVGIRIYYLVCFHNFNVEINHVNNASDPSLYQNTNIAFSVCCCDVTCCLDVSREKRTLTRHRFILYINMDLLCKASKK